MIRQHTGKVTRLPVTLTLSGGIYDQTTHRGVARLPVTLTLAATVPAPATRSRPPEETCCNPQKCAGKIEGTLVEHTWGLVDRGVRGKVL